MVLSLLKSFLHNIGVVVVGSGFAFLGTRLDLILGIISVQALYTIIAGWLLLIIGFLLRVWATFRFYRLNMKVISLVPQKSLIISGPFRFSRNPLYLGGNVFIFLGAVLVLGSPSGLFLTVINVILVEFMIRREEKQLERDFGQEWIRYRNRVRRWL